MTSNAQGGDRVALTEILLGLGIAALGVFIAVETSTIEVSPAYAKIGPQAIPYIVAGGLILFGLLFAAAAARRRAPVPHPAPASRGLEKRDDWRALAAISVGLAAQMLLLQGAGFVIAAAVLFFCVAFGFGSRRYGRDAAIAIVLALIVHVGFTRGLDLQLPAGVLDGVL
jgi:putative tricarboxylic transport membrane protein